MESTAADQRLRLILYHKQSTSGRTRFLRLAAGGVCAPCGLPQGSAVTKHGPPISDHPAAVASQVCNSMGLARSELVVETGFCVRVTAGEETLAVHLGRFTSVDPPFDAAQRCGSRFAALTELRDMSDVELGLLRQAYEWIMGG